MTPGFFAAIVGAETRKLFSRSSAKFGLGFAVFVGLAVPTARALLRVAEVYFATQLAENQGLPAPVFPAIEPDYVVYSTLWVRNFFLLRIVLIMMGALVFAGEYQSRTLREDLLRPMPRWSLLIAKWLALVAWVAATVVLVAVPALLISCVAWGFSGDWGEVALGYLVAIVADAGLAALVLLASVAIRSVAGTMVAMFLFYFVDVMAGIGLWMLSNWPFGNIPDWGRETAESAGPWLPSSAFGVWTGASDLYPWQWQSFVALGLITLVSLIVAERLFARLDVP